MHAGGKIKSFGIDLSQTPFTHHGSLGASIPYYALFFAAIGLQYMQMARLNKRNAANIQNNPQMQTMQTMQKVTPLIFGVIYIAFPIGVTVYFIVSSFCRIVIQEILFRTGVTAPKPAGQTGARDLPPPRRRGTDGPAGRCSGGSTGATAPAGRAERHHQCRFERRHGPRRRTGIERA